MSRSVFYAHFSGMTDFVLKMQQRHFDALAAAFATTPIDDLRSAGLEGQRALVAHFSDNRDLYRSVFSLSGSAGVAGTTAVIKRAIATHIDRFCQLPQGLTKEIAATYISGGITHLIASWLSDEDPIDDEVLARSLMDLMPDWLYERRTAPPAPRNP